MSAPKNSLAVAKIQDMTLSPFSHPKIDNAFAERPDLKQRIYNTIRKSPCVLVPNSQSKLLLNFRCFLRLSFLF